MTPSSLLSYQFLEPTPSSSLLHHTLLDPTMHSHGPTADPQPNTPAPPITDPTQSPPHTIPNSPGLTFPTNQPISHESHNTQTQNSPLPPPIFDSPNPQTNTDPVNEPPRTHPMITRSQSGISFKQKFHADGTLSYYKARLVANGSSHQLGVDFDETFSLVVKPATIRTVLSLDVSRKWPIHQLDV
ncbi:ribonuclease H-like domain-containing protein [Tanacetum coccineum]